MVVYERPPKTTPPVGKLERANPAVVIVKHKDYNRDRFRQGGHEAAPKNPTNEHGPPHIPIEDHLKQKATENAEHRVATSKDEVQPKLGDQPETTMVHVAPDSGTPGGAASIVNQMPKQTLNDASSARMVSLLPDVVPPPSPVNFNAPYNSGAYGLSRSNINQQAVAMPYSNPVASMPYQGYRYYGYPNANAPQSGQVRSLHKNRNWQTIYNQILLGRRTNG